MKVIVPVGPRGEGFTYSLTPSQSGNIEINNLNTYHGPKNTWSEKLLSTRRYSRLQPWDSVTKEAPEKNRLDFVVEAVAVVNPQYVSPPRRTSYKETNVVYR